MTIDTAFAALVEANPVPDANAYAEHRIAAAAFLTATRERTNDMQTTETQLPTKETTRRKWQPLVAVAAFFLVIALGVAAALMFQGTREVANVPAPPFDTPQEATEAYHVVLNAGDGDAYLALFADGASDGILNSSGITPDDKIKARVEAMDAYGVTWTVEECVDETNLRTKCTVMQDDPVNEMITGIREWRASIVVTIDEAGRIERIGMNGLPLEGEIDTDRVDAYDAWVTENHPELFDEVRFQLWGSDPLERSGAEIGRDDLAAIREFDAQYEG